MSYFLTMRVIGQQRCDARLGQVVALLRENLAVGERPAESG